MKGLSALLLLAVLSIVRSASAGEFKVRADDGVTVVSFSGEISSGDYRKLVAVIDRVNARGEIVGSLELNSPGGSANEAISIGRLVREKALATSSKINAQGESICASACALIWFGGVKRMGEVQVHRSYLAGSESAVSYGQMEYSLDASQKEIRTYHLNLRLPSTIAEDSLIYAFGCAEMAA